MAAAEKFKRVTTAYTQALLLSTKREREPPAASSGPTFRSGTGSSSGAARANRASYASPRATTGPVDGKRFNVREWESAHYGLHGATAEARQSQYVRNLYRQQRAQQQASAAYAAAGGQRTGGRGSAAMIMGTFAACVSVWTAVYRTNKAQGRFGPVR